MVRWWLREGATRRRVQKAISGARVTRLLPSRFCLNVSIECGVDTMGAVVVEQQLISIVSTSRLQYLLGDVSHAR